VELGAEDRVVGRVVDVGGAGVERQLAWRRDPREVLCFRRRGNLDGADALGFLDRLLRPGAGHDVICGAAGRQQVHRHHRELQARAALEEEHVIVLRDSRQRANIGLATLDHVVERFRAVADLEDRHADAGQREKVALRLLEHLDWQYGRSG
jgi:hypothetical protein